MEVPAKVYKVISDQQFVAFWQSEEGEIKFFMPANHWEKFFTGEMREYRQLRNNYDNEEHNLSKYDETVNAAWHFLALKGCYINKGQVQVSKIDPGTYFPRIWRGHHPEYSMDVFNAVDPRREYGVKHFQAVTASSSLFDDLVATFRYIEPSKQNLCTYGHKLRELLLLVATEVEACWRAVLSENCSEGIDHRATTAQFIKLKEVMRLDKWEVVLKDYPDLGEFSPFSNWNDAAPTKSLAWYDAYNATKHDREGAFFKATLEAVLNASAALHILQCAQWGPEIFDSMHQNRFSPFFTVKIPDLEAADIYMPALDQSSTLVPVRYFDVHRL